MTIQKRNFLEWRIALCLLLMPLAACLFGQQEAQYTNYMFNTLSFNPGYAGSKGYLSARVLYRDQWRDFGGGVPSASSDGRPVTQTFFVHARPLDKVGVGLSVINDQIGATASTSVDFSYAYSVAFGNGTLALGIQAGIMNWRADWDELQFRDPRAIDPSFAGENPTLWLPNFGAGIYYYNDIFYFGASIPRLTGIALRKDVDKTVVRRWAKIYQHFYITSGGIVPINGKVDFKPSVVIKSVGLLSEFLQRGDEIRTVGAPTTFDLNTSFLFYDKMWLGIGFRSAFAAIVEQNGTKSSVAAGMVLAGWQFDEGMRLGFSYDYPLTAIQNYTAGSFEVMLGMDFVRQIDKISHPRYFF